MESIQEFSSSIMARYFPLIRKKETNSDNWIYRRRRISSGELFRFLLDKYDALRLDGRNFANKANKVQTAACFGRFMY